MRKLWVLALLVSIVCPVVLSSCSGPKATRVDYAGGWSVECPAGFQYRFNTLSQGPAAELDITSASGSVSISVHGVNLPYSRVVDYAYVDENATMKGSLGEGIYVFQLKVPDSPTTVWKQHVYVVRDLGNLRTGMVEGRTSDLGQSAMDGLTDYCTRIANSMVAASAWVSTGHGEPGP